MARPHVSNMNIRFEDLPIRQRFKYQCASGFGSFLCATKLSDDSWVIDSQSKPVFGWRSGQPRHIVSICNSNWEDITTYPVTSRTKSITAASYATTNISWDSDLGNRKDTPMIFSVLVSAVVHKTDSDGTLRKIERVLADESSVVATDTAAAAFIAGKRLQEKLAANNTVMNDEDLSTATVVVKSRV